MVKSRAEGLLLEAHIQNGERLTCAGAILIFSVSFQS